MKLLLVAGLLLIGTWLVVATPAADSSTGPVEVSQELVVTTSLQPAVSARAYGVFDMASGEMLLAHNQDEALPIASVTKLFTAAAVLQGGALTEKLVITATDVATEGRAGKLLAGQTYEVRELLFPLLLESSNDAATALERQVKQIPFADTVLADASGLSSLNQATINDLATEVRTLYVTEPYIFDVTKLPQYIGEYTGWVNNSPVRDLPGYQGGKHGYTNAAGKTLVAVFTEPTLAGRELGYVLLGSDDLRVDTNELRQAVARSVRLE